MEMYMIKIKQFAVISFLMTAALSSCYLDPWITTESPTDKVTMTKVTKYAKMADGVTPMKSEVGQVVFSHKTHEAQGLDCASCHHKANNDDRIKKCAVCHIGNKGFDVMHGKCLDCHIAEGGPEKCKQCH